MGGGGRFRSFVGVVVEAVIFGVGVLVRVAYESELYLCPFGSFAIVTGVGWMWYVVVPLGSCVLVIREFHCVTPVSHSGARCLRSLLE